MSIIEDPKQRYHTKKAIFKMKAQIEDRILKNQQNKRTESKRQEVPTNKQQFPEMRQYIISMKKEFSDIKMATQNLKRTWIKENSRSIWKIKLSISPRRRTHSINSGRGNRR